MSIRPVQSHPVEIDDYDVSAPFIPGYFEPVDGGEPPEPPHDRRAALKRWAVRAVVFSALVGCFWCLGWVVVGAWLGWLMAIVGGVALLPYILMIDWKA